MQRRTLFNLFLGSIASRFIKPKLNPPQPRYYFGFKGWVDPMQPRARVGFDGTVVAQPFKRDGLNSSSHKLLVLQMHRMGLIDTETLAWELGIRGR